MQKNIFIPEQPAQPVVKTPVEASVVGPDRRSPTMRTMYVALLLFGLGVPLIFNPGLWASLGFTKVLLALVLVGVILIAGALHLLFVPRATIRIPWILFVAWGFALVAVAAALLAPDVQFAVRGSYFEVQSAGFIVVLVAVLTAAVSLLGSATAARHVLYALGASVSLLLLYSVSRILIGASFLPFGSFSSVTTSPLGGFNDLGLISGAVLVAVLTIGVMATLRVWHYVVLAIVSALAVFSLLAVNFLLVWWVVGIFAAGVFLHQLLLELYRAVPESRMQRQIMVVVSLLVTLLCGWYAFTNTDDGTKLQQWADISFVEVRPSFTATLDVMREVYAEQALIGAGPNQFATAWRTHKDVSINETIFWNTNFASGFSFILTTFVQLGVLGGTLLVVFQLWFAWVGYRALSAPQTTGSRWHMVTAVSVVSSVFLWVMTYLYAPGALVLLLAAFLTGISLAGIAVLRPKSALSLSITRAPGGPNIGKILVVLVVIGLTGAMLYSVLQQYRSESAVNQAAAANELTRDLATTAYAQYSDPRFLSLRAQLSAAQLQRLVQTAEPTEEEQAAFFAQAETAVEDARGAVAADTTNVTSHFILAAVFNVLANTGVDGARALALETLTAAESRDSNNPELALARAQVNVQAGDIEGARAALQDAIARKRNYTPALVLLTELEIAAGDLAAAIEQTRAIVTLEPRNPTRYFQLGMLYVANDQLVPAEAAYSAALTLDPEYANARYMLAQLYIAGGETDKAIVALERVQTTNQDNEVVSQLLSDLRTGSSTTPINTPDTEIAEPTTTVGTGNTVVTDEDPDTELVTPVNRATSEVADDPVLTE